MHYYVTLTTQCNSTCKYCYGKCCDDFGSDFGDYEIDYGLPSRIEYDLGHLRNFLGKDPESHVVFYGGEPLLECGKIKRIMDQIPARRFTVQTNGLMLDNLDADYVNRLDTILVSIDGDKYLTDFYRGASTYDRVVANLKLLKERGYDGEIVARMTVMRETEICTQVKHLLFNDDYRFSSVHWQLDALFWQNDFDPQPVSDWLASYNRQVDLLIEFWVDHMRRHGQVLRLYPLIGVMQSLLKNESARLRCGAGWIMFNIQTDGNITPCPVMAGMKDFYLGNIKDTDPSDLQDAVYVKEPCPSCSDYSACGGRCLYANVTRLWGDEGFDMVCGTVRNLVHGLQKAVPAVRDLIIKGVVSLKDFEHLKYNSCEIIP